MDNLHKYNVEVKIEPVISFIAIKLFDNFKCIVIVNSNYYNF